VITLVFTFYGVEKDSLEPPEGVGGY
jgi:hypothetical protein